MTFSCRSFGVAGHVGYNSTRRRGAAPMNFLVHCSCGRPHSVPESAAGLVLDCACGQKVHVPSLSEMHKQAGLAAYRPKATLLIAHMLADGELPPPRCAGCDAAETNVVDATAICEQAPRRGGGDNSEQRMLAALLFGWWVLLLPNRDGNEGSDDRTVRVPLRLCPHCRAALVPPASLLLLYCLAFLALAGGFILFFLTPAGFLLL